MKPKSPINNAQQLREKLIALRAQREVREAELISSAREKLRPASLVKNILHDIASERKVGLDLLRIGSGIVSGIIGAKSGMVGKGAMVADLLFKAVSSFRKKKNPDS